MTKKQIKQALTEHKAREAAKLASERIARKVVANYPYSHNPYVPHKPVEDCFPGCVNTEFNPQFDWA
mgnify:CR=1 FL=1